MLECTVVAYVYYASQDDIHPLNKKRCVKIKNIVSSLLLKTSKLDIYGVWLESEPFY